MKHRRRRRVSDSFAVPEENCDFGSQAASRSVFMIFVWIGTRFRRSLKSMLEPDIR